MYYLKATGEIYNISNFGNTSDFVLATDPLGFNTLLSKEDLCSKVLVNNEEKPLFRPLDLGNVVSSLSSEDLLKELEKRGDSSKKAGNVFDEYYTICRKKSPAEYVHIMKENTFTNDYKKAQESLAFYRSVESHPENLFIVCTRSIVFDD